MYDVKGNLHEDKKEDKSTEDKKEVKEKKAKKTEDKK